jgi:hypothetical protein
MLINARNYSFKLRDREIFTWPEQTAIRIFHQKPVMGLVHFTDTDAYHPQLIQYTLELEKDSDFTQPTEGGAKQVNALQDWDIVEADLINARALKLCGDMMHSEKVQVSSAYAVVFREGDHLPPKRPEKAEASVIYILDPGDEDPENGSSGRLSFTHKSIAGYTAGEPEPATAGVMLAFPADMLSATLPYTGTRPRILLVWHIVNV